MTRLRTRIFLTMSIIAGLPLQPMQAKEPRSVDLLGSWRVTRVLDSSDISAIDDRQAAQLVGKTFIIERDKVSLGGKTCLNPEFEIHYEDTVRYLREEAHAASGKLGLPTTVEVIDLACTEVLRKDYKTVVLYWQGYFFDAVKQETDTRHGHVPR